MSFQKLDELGRKLESLEHALSILGADEATHMAVGGGEKRAEAMSNLAGMYHAQATAPHIADWIDAARNEDLSPDQTLALVEFERSYVNATCLPTEFVERRTAATMRSEQLWRELRAKGDWDSFLPALEGVVSLVREEAALRSAATGLAPYDALMDQYDPGNRTADIDGVFADLKRFLKDFVPTALSVQEQKLARRPRKSLNAPFPIEKQRELGLAAMRAVGFDFTHGSLAVSHHPFCGGVPSDVRMTTRYRTDEFLSSLMGVLHETGHALYEQGLPKDWSHWPLGKARGMGMHESQSLFVEMQLARSPEFWEFMLPLVHQHLGDQAIAGWDIDDVLNEVNFVERGYIRVDADEVTYPLHVILRYELEQDLVSGKLEASQIPEAWDAKMVEYLGISTINDPKDGPMQDVHWPGGAFGYFPSYTLGAMIAAQLATAMEKDLPDMRSQMRSGDFGAINKWRADKVWSEASRYSTPDLITRATGEPLNADHFKAHLKRRYGG
ncbi:carboxypeptidase M32 [Devosia sp. XJ19-1]|uniref:Metal-dependent carboxypeptidase n=1 Tax=Devosia ureilytica TaxID=2952754 RepID=A0A9Q4FSA6_9HYPH|nr:carboxypeptidase M32 [Devosia ureilytica]MCP8883514.1 carboxypeptidase M32 [Devosia ureilytica]MCP8887122.1 carboxypeptidase M32 [Devosia ureilytica]